MRAGKGSCWDDEGSLHLVLFMVLLMGLLKWTAPVVFLQPLWERVQWGWSRLMSVSWKVTHLAIFLKPPGMGQVGTVRASMCE